MSMGSVLGNTASTAINITLNVTPMGRGLGLANELMGGGGPQDLASTLTDTLMKGLFGEPDNKGISKFNDWNKGAADNPLLKMLAEFMDASNGSYGKPDGKAGNWKEELFENDTVSQPEREAFGKGLKDALGMILDQSLNEAIMGMALGNMLGGGMGGGLGNLLGGGMGGGLGNLLGGGMGGGLGNLLGGGMGGGLGNLLGGGMGGLGGGMGEALAADLKNALSGGLGGAAGGNADVAANVGAGANLSAGAGGAAGDSTGAGLGGKPFDNNPFAGSATGVPFGENPFSSGLSGLGSKAMGDGLSGMQQTGVGFGLDFASHMSLQKMNDIGTHVDGQNRHFINEGDRGMAKEIGKFMDQHPEVFGKPEYQKDGGPVKADDKSWAEALSNPDDDGMTGASMDKFHQAKNLVKDIMLGDTSQSPSRGFSADAMLAVSNIASEGLGKAAHG